MFPMTITVSNTTQLAAVIAALGLSLDMPAVEQTPKETTKKQGKATVPSNGASSTQESPPHPPADAAAQGPAPAADSPSAPGAVSVTYDDVKVAILKLSNVKGRDAVLALLKPFGAAKGPELKPEQFAEFVAQANAAIAS